MAILRTGILMAAITALFLGVGYLIGGTGGMLIALAVALATNAFAYWNSDKLALRSHGAREVDGASAPDLVGLVRDLARRAGLPAPRIYVIESDQPNAFATGRSPANAAVAVTTGIMRTLSREELAGVIAHELAHIRNRDTLLMTVTATLAGAISMLANYAYFFRGRGNNGPGLIGTLAIMILAPVAAGLVQMAISRTREYEADRVGAEICAQPLWLASALRKIAGPAGQVMMESAERNPASAPLFIVNPLHGGVRDSLFATHPATANRVAALEAMAGRGGGVEEVRPLRGAAGPWN